MTTSKPYDLVIVGGGSAGLMAASLAVQFGARVALVEKHRIGGDCTWTGCVPSKTLLKAAKVAHAMRTADRYGLVPAEPAVDLGAVMDHVRSVVDEIYQEESPQALRADGIDVYLGGARFLDPHTLAAGKDTITARNVLITTGAHPYIPPIQGLENVDYVTYETIWELDTLPRHLLVVGAGPVGSEMAQAFRRLGSRSPCSPAATGSCRETTPMPRASWETFSDRKGSRWYPMAGSNWSGRMRQARSTLARAATGWWATPCSSPPDAAPTWTGSTWKRPASTIARSGIQVDDHLRTSQRHIYAAGDCTGGYQFTHYAGWQAAMAARNALLPGASKGVTDLVPWTTFTDPEVAHVGLTEAQAREQFGDAVKTCDWPMARVDRARTEGDTDGFIKLVHKQNGTLLGATIVAARAGEMIHEWIVALDAASRWMTYPTPSTSIPPTRSPACRQRPPSA